MEADSISSHRHHQYFLQVSGTAGGNWGVEDTNFPGEIASGIAPRARVAVYKVCWFDSNHVSGCSETDLIAAVDDAVADGVDVLSISIGSKYVSPAEGVAFLNAYKAGLSMAASAGNDGPFEATMETPAGFPWVVAVANSEDMLPVPDMDVLSFDSARGPNLVTWDVLKPDLTAPGEDIMAADWETNSLVSSRGTSMVRKFLLLQRPPFNPLTKT